MAGASFVHSHVFEPFGMRLFLSPDKKPPCGACSAHTATVRVFCDAQPLVLCQMCHNTLRLTWSIIVVYRDPCADKYMWNGPDKAACPTLPDAVKKWYVKHVSGST